MATSVIEAAYEPHEARFLCNQGTTTFYVNNGARLLLFAMDSNADNCGAWYVIANGSGTVQVIKTVISASGITFNTSTNKRLKVTVASGTARLLVFTFGEFNIGNVFYVVS